MHVKLVLHVYQIKRQMFPRSLADAGAAGTGGAEGAAAPPVFFCGQL